MNDHDLTELDLILAWADAVVSMREIHAGNTNPNVIGLRHDVDGGDALGVALRMAEWEAEREYRSTYFVLHTSSYFDGSGTFRRCLERLAVLGHEVGIHANAIAEALRTGHDPHEILTEAIELLRSWGHPIRGVVAHGDALCHQAGFVNDEQFLECSRPNWGAPDRELYHRGRKLRLEPRSLREFGLAYESYRLPKKHYNSDSSNVWALPLRETLQAQATGVGQIHLLVHPDHWSEVFA